MNILFLTLATLQSQKSSVHHDLLDCLRAHGHTLTTVCQTQRKEKVETGLYDVDGWEVLRVKTLNIKGQCNLIEKGLGTVLLEYQFIAAIKKYLSERHFNLVLYTTPPVTFSKVVSFVKKGYGAKSYLLLKDIFPQNAVDLGYFSKKNPFYAFFRNKEKVLYKNSDFIGCMSPANCRYLIQENSYLDKDKIEVNPNCRKERDIFIDKGFRAKYGIPTDKTVFIYGGNLGKPQGVSFLMDCIKANEKREDAFFVVIGAGSERVKLENLFKENEFRNSLLLEALPSEDYEKLCASCDVGFIFLDKRFTIPNFPSRSLSYMQAKMPYIAAVDKTTDIGTIAEENGFGLNCLWGDLEGFNQCIDSIAGNKDKIQEMGNKAYDYFKEHYTVEKSYEIIMKHFM